MQPQVNISETFKFYNGMDSDSFFFSEFFPFNTFKNFASNGMDYLKFLCILPRTNV